MKPIRTYAAIALVALSFTACKKAINETHEEDISATTLSQIKQLGFSTEGAHKVQGGYLVEGDIFLNQEALASQPNSPNLVIAKEEQYHTFNLVSKTKHPVIKVALNNSSANHDAAFSAALDEAIRRYNAENLEVTFQRVTTGADITVVAYYQVSSTLGSAGFPTSDGSPYHEVKMNTYHYSNGTGTTNVNYISTIMAHEIGHCIGFRHTDYMDRSFSCGGRRTNEEKPFASGYGVVHIPGTPTTPDAASWMLACIGTNVNRPFNSNDRTALNHIY
jgi:hypothetical protein